VNAPSLQFSLGGFLVTHFDKLEIRVRWDHRKLRERLVGSENMRASFGRRFERPGRISSATTRTL
jgi:hypothetical protein